MPENGSSNPSSAPMIGTVVDVFAKEDLGLASRAFEDIARSNEIIGQVKFSQIQGEIRFYSPYQIMAQSAGAIMLSGFNRFREMHADRLHERGIRILIELESRD